MRQRMTLLGKSINQEFMGDQQIAMTKTLMWILEHDMIGISKQGEETWIELTRQNRSYVKLTRIVD